MLHFTANHDTSISPNKNQPLFTEIKEWRIYVLAMKSHVLIAM